jgi:hypothetical protein
MEKWKRQRDVESGGGILTYMQKVGKMTFTKGPLKVTHLPKSYQTKSEVHRNIQ